MIFHLKSRFIHNIFGKISYFAKKKVQIAWKKYYGSFFCYEKKSFKRGEFLKLFPTHWQWIWLKWYIRFLASLNASKFCFFASARYHFLVDLPKSFIQGLVAILLICATATIRKIASAAWYSIFTAALTIYEAELRALYTQSHSFETRMSLITSISQKY